MDAFGKAVLTACVVAAVLAVARRLGPRAAGVVAGLPVINAPAMAWLAHDAGSAFSAGSAVAGVAAGAMLAAFALCYAHVARRAGVASAAAAGLLAACVLAVPALAASRQWATALLFGAASCAVALRALPSARAVGAERPVPGPAAMPVAGAYTAAAAGGVSALAAGVGPLCGMFVAGLVASLPVVSASVAVAAHAAGGHAAVNEFLRGYVLGLFGRAAFGTVFALAVVPLGVACAVALGCAAAVVVTGFVTAPRTQRAFQRCRYHLRDGRRHVVDRACPHG